MVLNEQLLYRVLRMLDICEITVHTIYQKCQTVSSVHQLLHTRVPVFHSRFFALTSVKILSHFHISFQPRFLRFCCPAGAERFEWLANDAGESVCAGWSLS